MFKKFEDDEKEELKKQVEEDKKSKLGLENEVIFLTKQVEECMKKVEMYQNDSEVLQMLYDQGVIDSKGDRIKK